MFRRISNKLVLAVLAAVLVPFAAFAFFVDTQMAERLSREVVLYSLKGLAADLSQRIERKIEERNSDIVLWTQSPLNVWAIEEYDLEATGGDAPRTSRTLQAESFDAAVESRQVYDLVLLLNSKGRLVASNRHDASGEPLPFEVLESLHGRDYSGEPWFREALTGGFPRLDPHVSDLLPLHDAAPGTHAENYQIGFAGGVPRRDGEPGTIGVVFSLVNWSHFQEEVSEPVLKAYFQGLVGQDEYPTAYGWIWGADADTILAHPRVELYGQRVSGPVVGLPELVEAARETDWGLFQEYTFEGKRKNAAFKHCAGPRLGGFGWVVGVGINNDDIYATVQELRGLLYRGTALVVLVVLLWTLVIARRTTSPILALTNHTQRVAAGDLETRIPVTGDDELAELSRAFNQMTSELATNRVRLVKAEKDAAWREMARQVAHDIKNPLTPIQLSADLLRRAHQERSPEFESIFERTMETISRQVANLRSIASDFHALTGAHKQKPEVFDVGTLVDEVLELNAAWADDLGVHVSRGGAGGTVRVDPDLLRRALINLCSNAFEAMPEGGRLDVRVEPLETAGGGVVRIEIRDTGAGISEEARPHLFEPYFTTRSTGTGLGLAIAKRVVEEMGGTIELEPGQGHEGGTLARVVLPAHREAERA